MSDESRKNVNFLDELAYAVAAGAKIADAAEQLGRSARSAYALSRTNEFRRRVSEIRSEALQAVIGRLSGYGEDAIATMHRLMGPEGPPAVQLNAAKAIIGAIAPLTELGELRGRMEELERRLEEHEHHDPES